MAVEILGITIEGTIAEFINYAMIVVTIMLIYYIIKFFTVAPPTDEERKLKRDEENARAANVRKWVGKKWNETEDRRKKGTKKNKVSPIINNLKLAQDALDTAVEKLTRASDDSDRNKVVRALKTFDQQLKGAWNNLRLLRRNAEGTDKDTVKSYIDALEAIREHYHNNIKGTIAGANWTAEKATILNEMKTRRSELYNLWNEIERYYA